MNFITINSIDMSSRISEIITLNIDHIVWFSADELLIRITTGLTRTDTESMNKLLDYIHKEDKKDG